VVVVSRYDDVIFSDNLKSLF